MNTQSGPRQFSVYMKPEADIEGHYTAALCAREIVQGLPSGPEYHAYLRPHELQPVLRRLGIAESDIFSALSHFGHEQAISLMAALNADTLQHEGFQRL